MYKQVGLKSGSGNNYFQVPVGKHIIINEVYLSESDEAELVFNQSAITGSGLCSDAVTSSYTFADLLAAGFFNNISGTNREAYTGSYDMVYDNDTCDNGQGQIVPIELAGVTYNGGGKVILKYYELDNE